MTRPQPGLLPAVLLALLLAGLLAACQQGPDRNRLVEVVQARLDAGLPPGTFTLTSLRRQGSGPLDPDAQGRSRRIVYFNAVLTLGRDLDFSAWDGLNVAAFAALLGATEKGVSGLAGGGNRRGDQVLVHGSASFVLEDGTWTPVEAFFPAVGSPSPGYSSSTSAQSQRLIERIVKLFERQTSDPPRQGQIIKEELDQAYSDITLRLDRLDRALIVAGGPTGGEYLGVARLLAQALVADGIPANAMATDGSVANLDLLRQHKADLALVQNNMAAQAQLGTGAFTQAGPDYELRALASLFPEPIHLLVATASPIRALSDLAGGRIEIGQPDSGSRANSIALLEAAGIDLAGLSTISEVGLEAGLARLAAGEIDAVIATIGAPTRRVQEAAARGDIRFLPLPPQVQGALVGMGAGLLPMELPPATYPGQRGPVSTVASTAMLVGPDGLPRTDVDRVLSALFDGIDFVRAGSAAGSLIGRETANLALTVPMHPAAIAYLGLGPGGGPAPGRAD